MHPLDNPIWHALVTRQAGFAQNSGPARKFIPEVGPLAGFENGETDGYEALAELLEDQDAAAVFLEAPYEPRDGWEFLAGAPLLQMIAENGAPPVQPSTRMEIVELGARDCEQMIELTELTKPGPFGPRTHELGTYVGIREMGKVVAMAGERLKVPGYTEVSAVCTHPDCLGRGYAAALMREVIERIGDRGETPFLHVRGDNRRAIALYERLGFRTRWAGHFAVLKIKRDVASNVSFQSH